MRVTWLPSSLTFIKTAKDSQTHARGDEDCRSSQDDWLGDLTCGTDIWD